MHAQQNKAAISTPLSWYDIPTEVKYGIADMLVMDDIQHFCKANREAYALSVPSLFKTVKLDSCEELQSFLDNVPPAYGCHVRTLTVCTTHSSMLPALAGFCVTEGLTVLLSRCTQIEKLELNLEGSLKSSILPCFAMLSGLKTLSISNRAQEQETPLSERLVVSIAASVPSLTELSLDRITRSVVHAPELLGGFNSIPVVIGDENIPLHPILESSLNLPSLLRLPNLRYLRIRDTHLGDAEWSTVPVCSPIEVLDLGSCFYESPEFNRVCTERIIGNIGNTVGEFSVNTPLTTESFDFTKPKETPLKRLRKVHLTPLVPVENLVGTLSTLSGSPVEQLSVACHEDDVDDMCTALGDFFSLQMKGQDQLFPLLTEISLHTVGDDLESVTSGITIPATSELPAKDEEGAAAVGSNPGPLERLQKLVRDLRLMQRATKALSETTTRLDDCPAIKQS